MEKLINFTSAFKIALAFGLVAVLLFLLFLVSDILLIFLVAIILAIALDKPIDKLVKAKLPRSLATVIIYGLVVVFFSFSFYLILPPLAIELKGFVVNVLGNFDSLVEQPDQYWLMFNLTSTEFSQYLKQFSDLTLANSQTIISGFFKVFGGFVSVLVIFFVALFLNVQQNGVRHFLPFFVKEKNLDSATKFFEKMQNQVGSWFWAKTMSSILVGLIIFFSLSVLKINYALLLAVLAMLLNFVPFIGPMITSLPALLIAFIQSPWLAIAVLIIYFVTNIVIEGFIFIPLVMKKEIQMNSALIIIFVLIGGKLGGILGVIISIPVAAIVSLVLDEYRQRL